MYNEYGVVAMVAVLGVISYDNDGGGTHLVLLFLWFYA